MKHLSALSLLLLVCSWSQAVRAQTAGSWVNVSPVGERFTIQMPKDYVVKPQKNSFDRFKLEGHVYTATSDGVAYTVWIFVDGGFASNGPPDKEAYLDACADLVWESLLKPLRDQLPKKPEVVSYMSYQGELAPARLPPGREYTIMLGNRPGVTHFHVAGPQIYVLTVLYADVNGAATQHFINSFGLRRPELPVAPTLQADPVLVPPSARVGTDTGGGVGPGRGGNVGGGERKVGGVEPPTGAGASTDYNRIFPGRDVTEKARVFTKPEPVYTDSGRKYSVQGTVVLRAVFSNTGQVNNIRAIKRLPHGLTERAIGAARQISFSPALKDGHVVSMHIQLEYNFNLY